MIIVFPEPARLLLVSAVISTPFRFKELLTGATEPQQFVAAREPFLKLFTLVKPFRSARMMCRFHLKMVLAGGCRRQPVDNSLFLFSYVLSVLYNSRYIVLTVPSLYESKPLVSSSNCWLDSFTLVSIERESRSILPIATLS